MIYVSLPDFYLNYNIINRIKNIKEEYLKYPVTFSEVTGNFPFCYWNGGFNANYMDSFALNEELNDVINHCQIPIRFNCANIYLQPEDYDDTYANLILAIGENGSNTISISNVSLWNILQEKYPFYSFVFSREADLIYKMDANIVNTLCESGNFELVELPICFKKLDKIKQKDKVELLINTNNIADYDLWRKELHKSHYNFSDGFYFSEYNNQILIPEEELKEYVAQGFYHFAVDSFSNEQDLANFLVKYFIKPEFQLQIYEELMK